VGQDCYARDGSVRDPWGHWRRALESVAAFARERGKRMAVSEWGTSLDDADLVRSFLRWAHANSIAYHIYWNVPPIPGEEDTRLAGQPNAARAYLENGA
jgi:sugar phosphate isomerase/epimerase